MYLVETREGTTDRWTGASDSEHLLPSKRPQFPLDLDILHITVCNMDNAYARPIPESDNLGFHQKV